MMWDVTKSMVNNTWLEVWVKGNALSTGAMHWSFGQRNIVYGIRMALIKREHWNQPRLKLL